MPVGGNRTGGDFFKPRGIPLRSLQQVVITVDELEAMRLADFLEMTQEEVAQRLQVSRPTVTRMLSRAHRAVAEALVHGKAICIQGAITAWDNRANTAGNGRGGIGGPGRRRLHLPRTRRRRQPAGDARVTAAVFHPAYQSMARIPLRGDQGDGRHQHL